MGAVPVAVGLNPRTHTLYAANVDDGTVSVIDVAHCNALDESGCTAVPPAVAVGDRPAGVAVDPASDTVYVSLHGFEANAVAVLHGSQPVATIPVGANPIGVTLERATHTLYVANDAVNDAPGTVSVVDTRHCNALDTSMCAQAWPTAPAGRGVLAIAIEPRTHRVFTVNQADATVSVIHGATCNATNLTGCGRTPPRVPIGNVSFDLTLDRANHTLYTANAYDRSVSVIGSLTPCHAPVRCER